MGHRGTLIVTTVHIRSLTRSVQWMIGLVFSDRVRVIRGIFMLARRLLLVSYK